MRHFAPGAGQSITMGNDIAGQKGVAGVAGQTSLVMSGLGLLTLGATSQFSGGIALNSGTLSLQAAGASGSGSIGFGYGSTAALLIGAGGVPPNVLNVTGGSVPVALQPFTGQNFTGERFVATSAGNGGAGITAVTINNDMRPVISGAALNGNDHTAFAPLKNVKISAINTTQTESATLIVSKPANGGLSSLGAVAITRPLACTRSAARPQRSPQRSMGWLSISNDV